MANWDCYNCRGYKNCQHQSVRTGIKGVINTIWASQEWTGWTKGVLLFYYSMQCQNGEAVNTKVRWLDLHKCNFDGSGWIKAVFQWCRGWLVDGHRWYLNALVIREEIIWLCVTRSPKLASRSFGEEYGILPEVRSMAALGSEPAGVYPLAVRQLGCVLRSCGWRSYAYLHTRLAGWATRAGGRQVSHRADVPP